MKARHEGNQCSPSTCKINECEQVHPVTISFTGRKYRKYEFYKLEVVCVPAAICAHMYILLNKLTHMMMNFAELDGINHV